MLNSNIKKLQTDIQTQNTSLENLESTQKKLKIFLPKSSGKRRTG